MKLILVDPNLRFNSPAMKGVLRSLPALKQAGFEIEGWCWHHEPDLPLDRIVKLPRVGNMQPLGGYAFALWARLRAWWLHDIRKQPKPDVLYSVGWYLKDCDVVHVHFSPFDWQQRQRILGVHSLRDLYEWLVTFVAVHWTRWSVRGTTAQNVLVVSRSVAEDMRKENPSLPVEVLPNAYDATRFHSGVAQNWRTEMRQRLHLKERETVFVFVSAGHYKRKGFFLAAKAVQLCNERLATEAGAGPRSAKLLVVGGTPERIKGLEAELQDALPGWRNFVQFTGMVSDVERYLAASDALLFPSYSEAFALVEVEAAACGLPLFLTPHHGSEMILQDGVNGRSISFNPAEASEVLAEFVTGAWKPAHNVSSNAIDAEEYAIRLTQTLLNTALSKNGGMTAATFETKCKSCPAPLA